MELRNDFSIEGKQYYRELGFNNGHIAIFSVAFTCGLTEE